MHYYAALLVMLGYSFFCGCCWWHYRRQQPIASTPQKIANGLLIGYASQTGNAARLATQTAQQLQTAGLSAQVLPLNQITADLLISNQTLLVVASTYGEGESPDNADRFIPRNLAILETNALAHLQIGVLALGDSSYQSFCGYAQELSHHLQHLGATLLFDMVEVDNLDESSLRHWQYYLGQFSGQSHFSDWINPSYSHWQLVARDWVNPGSPGAPAYHLQLQPLNAAIEEDTWSPGDIAEIGPCNSSERIDEFLHQLGRTDVTHNMLSARDLMLDPEQWQILRELDAESLVEALPELPHREYSIASIPAEKSLHLLVRQVRDVNHQLGLGSGWLTAHALLESPIRLRIRSNPHFHAPALSQPLILIGNGTGIAGLRAHIAARAQVASKNWLFFGERTYNCDYFFAEDIKSWQGQGVLTRVDVAFSRDASRDQPRYVQDLLPQHATEIRAWITAGAAIYVCGSLRGMAQGVDNCLQQILGEQLLETLSDQGRYRRDVY